MFLYWSHCCIQSIITNYLVMLHLFIFIRILLILKYLIHFSIFSNHSSTEEHKFHILYLLYIFHYLCLTCNCSFHLSCCFSLWYINLVYDTLILKSIFLLTMCLINFYFSQDETKVLKSYKCGIFLTFHLCGWHGKWVRGKWNIK